MTGVQTCALPILANGGAQEMPDLSTDAGLIGLFRGWGDPELVVIDSLSSLAHWDGSDPKPWNKLQAFARWNARKGRTILFVHHTNKHGERRGGHARDSELDLVMGLCPPRGLVRSPQAHFEIHFDRAPGLTPAAREPIEARLDSNEIGRAHV